MNSPDAYAAVWLGWDAGTWPLCCRSGRFRFDKASVRFLDVTTAQPWLWCLQLVYINEATTPNPVTSRWCDLCQDCFRLSSVSDKAAHQQLSSSFSLDGGVCFRGWGGSARAAPAYASTCSSVWIESEGLGRSGAALCWVSRAVLKWLNDEPGSWCFVWAGGVCAALCVRIVGPHAQQWSPGPQLSAHAQFDPLPEPKPLHEFSFWFPEYLVSCFCGACVSCCHGYSC